MDSFMGHIPSSVRRASRKNRRLAEKAVKNVTQQQSAPPGNSFLPTNLKRCNPPQRPATSSGSSKTSKTTKTQKPSFPTKIDASEFSISYIDTKIKEKLSYAITNIEELEEELITLIRIALNDKDPYQRVLASQRQEILRKRIRDIETGMELIYYIYRTEKLINEFKELESQTTQNFIGGFKDDGASKESRTESRKNSIIREYLSIAREYIDLENLKIKSEKMVCEACDCTEFSIAADNDYLYICNKCGGEIEYFDDNPSFKDSDRVNMSSKYRYSRKGHFIEACKKFQGTQNVDPRKIRRVVKILEEEMRLNNLVPEQGLPNSVTKDNLDNFLSSCRLNSHYDDLNLIHHIITGVPCPDISMYMDRLLVDVDLLERVLIEIQDEGRVNSLNVYFKLYKLLQRYGAPYKKEDFYILKTQVKEYEHDLKMKEAFDILGWDWIAT